jgi:hypothetical protein
MSLTEVIGWVFTVTSDLRLSQAKTLAELGPRSCRAATASPKTGGRSNASNSRIMAAPVFRRRGRQPG